MSIPTFPLTNTLTAYFLMALLLVEQVMQREFQKETACYRWSEYIRQLSSMLDGSLSERIKKFVGSVEDFEQSGGNRSAQISQKVFHI